MFSPDQPGLRPPVTVPARGRRKVFVEGRGHARRGLAQAGGAVRSGGQSGWLVVVKSDRRLAAVGADRQRRSGVGALRRRGPRRRCPTFRPWRTPSIRGAPATSAGRSPGKPVRRCGAFVPYFLTILLPYSTLPARARARRRRSPPARLAGQAGCGAGRGGDNAARECGASGRAGTVRAMARSDHTGAWFHAGVPMRCREGRLRRPAPDEPRQDLAGSASGSARRNARERNSPSGSCPGRSRHRRLPRRTRPTPGFVMSGFV